MLLPDDDSKNDVKSICLGASAAMPAGAFNKWVVPVRIVMYAADRRVAANNVLVTHLSAFRARRIFADSMEVSARHPIWVWNWRLGDRHVLLAIRTDNFVH